MPDDLRFPDFCPPDSCRAENGASLPPRKRLLAGLKQNGWLSCSSSYAAAWQSTGAPCAGLLEEVNLEVDLDGAKMVEEPGKCEAGSECLGESGDGTIAQVESNADENMDSEKSENASKRRKSYSLAANSRGSVEKLSRMTRESHNRGQFRKKGKASKPAPSSDLASTASRPKNDSVSHHEMAAAAKLTAAMAAKTAAKAKAVAANKAAAAAKAAAVAKAALEAVAIAACDNSSKRRRNSIRRHPKPDISCEKQKSKEAELKKGLQSVSQMPAPVDDEELARQLHRAMNSSPRISRNLPCRKEDGPPLSPNQRRVQGNYQRGRRRSCSLKDVEKQEVKTARQIHESSLSGCVGEDVKSKSIININDTRPVYSSLQEAECFCDKNSGDFELVSPGFKGLADNGLRLKKVEALHSCEKRGKKSRKKYFNENHIIPAYHEGGSITESNPASKNESIYSNNEIGCNLNSEDSAAVQPDVVDVEQSVNQIVSIVRELKEGGIRCGNNHKISSESSLVTCGNEMQDVHSERDNKDAEKESAVSTERQLAISPNATEAAKLNGIVQYGKQVDSDRPGLDLPVQDLGDTEIELKGKAEASGQSLGFDIQQKKSSQKEMTETSTVKDVLKRTGSESRNKGLSKSVAQSKHANGEGQTWHQDILKGLPKGLSTGKQTFGSTLTPFRSAPLVSIRTPAFASGPTGRHS